MTSPTDGRHKKHLQTAVSLAELSDHNSKHGAVIVKGGTRIAVGINYQINDPNQVTHPKTESGVHAEVAALNACRKVNLMGATIYVARVLRDGCPAISKPCDYCQQALQARGIKRVVYTT